VAFDEWREASSAVVVVAAVVVHDVYRGDCYECPCQLWKLELVMNV
jgi:hypothetical protein